MTGISKTDVIHLAQLSRVSLSDEEANQLKYELTTILGYVAQLSELDTQGVEPTCQLNNLHNVWHDDVANPETLTSADLLGIAPSLQSNQIKVPKVF